MGKPSKAKRYDALSAALQDLLAGWDAAADPHMQAAAGELRKAISGSRPAPAGGAAGPPMQLRSRRTLVEAVDVSGLSERQVAIRAGLGHATVNHLLTGRRTGCTSRTARAIAGVLGCELHWLFTEQLG